MNWKDSIHGIFQIEKRNGKYLIKALKDHPLILYPPVDTEERQNAFWWAPFVLDAEKLKVSVKQFVQAMEAEGVPVYGVQWPEMYKEQVYIEQNGFGKLKYPFRDPNARKIDYTKVECKKARWLSERTMSFFTHPVYNEDHMRNLYRCLRKGSKGIYEIMQGLRLSRDPVSLLDCIR